MQYFGQKFNFNWELSKQLMPKRVILQTNWGTRGHSGMNEYKYKYECFATIHPSIRLFVFLSLYRSLYWSIDLSDLLLGELSVDFKQYSSKGYHVKSTYINILFVKGCRHLKSVIFVKVVLFLMSSTFTYKYKI